MAIVKVNRYVRIYFWRQCLLALSGLVHGICAGGVFVFTSILIPQLDNVSNNTQYDGANLIQLSREQQSWIASVPTLAMFPATLMAGWALETFGRKKMTLTSILFNLVGWMIMYLCKTYPLMLMSRILSGIFAGMGYTIFLTYIGEVTDPRYRPFFLSFLPLGTTIGVFLCQLGGTFLHWQTLALLICVIPVYNSIIMGFYISESYIWHINRNEVDKANRCFTWFRGQNSRALDEFQKASENILKDNSPQESTPVSKLSLFKDKTFLKPFGITTLTFTTGQLSGNVALIFYTSSIIEIMTNDKSTEFYVITALNILRIFATAAACFLMRVISARRLLFTGGCILSVCLFSLALFLHLSTVYPDITILPTLCMIAVTINVIFFAGSLGPIPSVICGELYPGETRGFGGSLSACVSFLSLFIIVKIMPLMVQELTAAGMFLLFGIFTILGVGILQIVLPNTKNKTLKEIGKMYE